MSRCPTQRGSSRWAPAPPTAAPTPATTASSRGGTRTYPGARPGPQLPPEQAGLGVAAPVRREALLPVMQAARDDERLAFDFLRSLSGVDYLDELEVVYHLYSYRHDHSAAIKARCPPDHAHMPTVSHLWQTSNWHEREAAEMFGFVFDGHRDLRPLLAEEGLGYYALRKTHPLAEIEEGQGGHPKAAGGDAAPAGAGARGPSGDDDNAAVQAAIKAFEDEMAGAAEAAPAPAAEAPPPAAGDRAAK